MKISDVLEGLNRLAPLEGAEKWDNVGLLLGNKKRQVKNVLVSIDLTMASVQEAQKKNCQLIINHHPCIFPKKRGITEVTSGPVLHALEQKIAVASFHTNFDKSALEVSDAVARGFGLKPLGRFLESEELIKLVVFTPMSHFEVVRHALAEAGAGHIGNYDSCAFRTQGQGFFKGQDGAKPFKGKKGVLVAVDEYRLETVFQKSIQKQVVSAIKMAHPYEEVAFDLYPVIQKPINKSLVAGIGYGVFGDLVKPKSYAELIRSVKDLFQVKCLLVTNRPEKGRKIKRVGFVAGKGASFLRSAHKLGCDVFITGEAGFHNSLEAQQNGMTVLELGHRESEVFFPKIMSLWLKSLGVKSLVFNERIQVFE